LISVQAEDCANGHSPGAINMPGTSIFTAENRAKLPKDRQIVLNCYSGQTASQATSALRMLGYDAYNMQFGMPAWAIVDESSSPGAPTGHRPRGGRGARSR
jgi:rhodanese-related sulfurtransferase